MTNGAYGTTGAGAAMAAIANAIKASGAIVRLEPQDFLGGVDGETERWQRNWFDNETILSGIIDSAANEPNRVDYVVVSDVLRFGR